MQLDSDLLFKLSEKAFSINDLEKNQYYSKFIDIIRNNISDEDKASAILDVLCDIFEERKLEIAAGSVNKAAEKVRGGTFRRVNSEAGSVFGEKDPIETSQGVTTKSGLIILK
jgi:hypothetical protein